MMAHRPCLRRILLSESFLSTKFAANFSLRAITEATLNVRLTDIIKGKFKTAKFLKHQGHSDWVRQGEDFDNSSSTAFHTRNVFASNSCSSLHLQLRMLHQLLDHLEQFDDHRLDGKTWPHWAANRHHQTVSAS